MVRALVKEVYSAGGYPYVKISDYQIERELALECSREQLALQYENVLVFMKEMDAYISITAPDNMNELSDIDQEKINLMSEMSKKVLDERVNNTKWVVLRYPNNSMAQKSGKSLEAFEDYYFKVCNLDYSFMNEAMKPLLKLMSETDNVRIIAEGTDLSFSIKGIKPVPCAGKMNIPDGEVYTAHVRNSVNGVITYNTPSHYRGFTYKNIRFEVENGKIVNAVSNNTERMNKILDSDEGARYFGEFALGVNPFITEPMENILFDEKIMGSIHFTPGQCYDETDNGNKSQVHWDLVQIHTPEFGGGEIYFDGKLIRKDGMFVTQDLKCLNPENLR